MESSTKNCIGKVLEIPIIYSASLNVGNAYKNLKAKSKISNLSFEIVEGSFLLVWQGLTPLAGRLRKSIDFADAVACFVLDEVKVKYPGIMEPTDKLIESGTKVVLHSSLAQTALVGLEKALGFAEAIITLVPSISVSDDAEEQISLISKTMKPVKLCYVTATWPLRCTGNFLHSRRSYITAITRMYQQSENAVKLYPRDGQRKTLAYRIFYIPRFLLCYIGKATCELCEKRILKSNLCHQFSVDQQVQAFHEELQHPSDDTLAEDENLVSVSDLNKSVNTSATDEAAYHPCSGDEMTDSFEYHSGTDEDTDSSVTLLALGEIANPNNDMPQAIGEVANPNIDIPQDIGEQASYSNNVPWHHYVHPAIILDQEEDPYLANMNLIGPENAVPIEESLYINGDVDYSGEGSSNADTSSTPELQ